MLNRSDYESFAGIVWSYYIEDKAASRFLEMNSESIVGSNVTKLSMNSTALDWEGPKNMQPTVHEACEISDYASSMGLASSWLLVYA